MRPTSFPAESRISSSGMLIASLAFPVIVHWLEVALDVAFPGFLRLLRFAVPFDVALPVPEKSSTVVFDVIVPFEK